MYFWLIILFFIFYFLFSLYRLDWAILFLIAMIPSYLIRFQIFGIPFTFLEAMILISFAVWFFRETEFASFLRGKYKIKDYLENRKKRISYPFAWEIILLLVISFTAVGAAHFSNNALGIWKAYFFEPVLFFVLVLNTSPRLARLGTPLLIRRGDGGEVRIENIIFALSISAFVVSAFAIYQKFTGAFIANPFWAAEATRRVTSFFPYPNAVGLFLAPLVLVFVGYLFSIFNFQFSIFKQFSISKFSMKSQSFKLQAQSLFLVFTIFFSCLAIYFAESEGAIIGVVAGLFVFGLLAGKKIRWATIGLGLILLVGVLSYAPTRNYFVEKATLNDLSGQIRRQQWTETKKLLFSGAWLRGTGLDNYESAVKPFHQEGIFIKNDDPDWLTKIRNSAEYRQKMWQPTEIYHYPHNIILNFWTELGLFGMLLFVWIIAKYAYLAIINYQLSIINKKSFIENCKLKIENYSTDEIKFINLGLISAMVVVIIHGTVDVPYFKNDLAVIFWLFIALLSIINLNLKYYGREK